MKVCKGELIVAAIMLWFCADRGQANDLTRSHWQLTGLDEANNSWSSTTLVFTSQEPVEGGFQVKVNLG